MNQETLNVDINSCMNYELQIWIMFVETFVMKWLYNMEWAGMTDNTKIENLFLNHHLSQRRNK